MGAWLLYHIIALLHVYGGASAASLEGALHESLAVVDLGSLIGAAGPAFVITYGAIITFAILVSVIKKQPLIEKRNRQIMTVPIKHTNQTLT
jgi:hypothetical protein